MEARERGKEKKGGGGEDKGAVHDYPSDVDRLAKYFIKP